MTPAFLTHGAATPLAYPGGKFPAFRFDPTGRTLVFAGTVVRRAEVRGTINMLSYYREFLLTDKKRCVNPEGGWPPETTTREEARLRLAFLLDVAINRKAGVPDAQGRKQEPLYLIGLRRDAARLQDIARRVRVYQFDTPEVGRRLGHLLSDRNG